MLIGIIFKYEAVCLICYTLITVWLWFVNLIAEFCDRPCITKVQTSSNLDIIPDIFSDSCSDSLKVERFGDRIPLVSIFPAPVQTGPRALSASCTMGSGSFPGKSSQGVALTTHPQLMPKLNKE
jgi:hypothetical protein